MRTYFSKLCQIVKQQIVLEQNIQLQVEWLDGVEGEELGNKVKLPCW